MKIVLAGGGTGGHFYPLVAVAESIHDIVDERRLVEPQLFYIGPAPFDAQVLIEQDIVYVPGTAGRTRRYTSILNFLDVFKTGWGIVRALAQLFSIYPDAVFSTGGFAAFPTLVAARLLRIPVIIYDADAAPGRVSLWSSRFARAIAVAHSEAIAAFPAKVQEIIARTGHPIRAGVEEPTHEGGSEFLKLDPNAKTVFIMGGSQGATSINEVVLNALPTLVKDYNIVHQTGRANLESVEGVAGVVLRDSEFRTRYRPFGLLNVLALRMAAGLAGLVVARAGSGTIFEVASWGLPAVLIPLPLDISHDQTENAFSYARAGAAVVLEQHNLTPHLLIAEIDRIMNDEALREKMSAAAKAYARPQAARTIAEMIMQTALEHQKV